MTRGRPPLPTAVKLARGTLRRDRVLPDEAAPRPGTPTPPDWLGEEARKEWRRLVPQLRIRGLVEVIDRAALVAYVTAWEDLVLAQRDLAEQGSTTITARGGIIAHPALRRAQVARQQIQRLAAEFGITPASRGRVRATPPSAPARGSRAERFFGRPRDARDARDESREP